MLALALSLYFGAACAAPAVTPTRPTVTMRGDSIMQGTCNTVPPPTYVDTNLPGGLTEGWLVRNNAVSGETAAQILSRYTTEEATACSGTRCAYLVIQGGVNSLRTGSTPAATLTSMVAIVDDALSKGYRVVWLDVMPYKSFSGAGANPEAQALNYNAAWAAACSARVSNPRLRCLANYATFVDANGNLAAPFSCDGVHTTDTGAALLGSRILTELLAFGT